MSVLIPAATALVAHRYSRPWVSPDPERRIDDLISPEIPGCRFDVNRDAAAVFFAYPCGFADGSPESLVEAAIHAQGIICAVNALRDKAPVCALGDLQGEH
jgi:hypothetical protein